MTVLLTIADLSPQERSHLLVLLSVLMVVVVIGFCAILLIRRQLRSPKDTDASGSVGFSLSDLRTMRDQGEITSEEYEATRAKVIAKVKSSLAAQPPRKAPAVAPPIQPLEEELPDEPSPPV